MKNGKDFVRTEIIILPGAVPISPFYYYFPKIILLLTWVDEIHGFTMTDMVLNKHCTLARGKDLIRTGKNKETKCLSAKIVTYYQWGKPRVFKPILLVIMESGSV